MREFYDLWLSGQQYNYADSHQLTNLTLRVVGYKLRHKGKIQALLKHFEIKLYCNTLMLMYALPIKRLYSLQGWKNLPSSVLQKNNNNFWHLLKRINTFIPTELRLSCNVSKGLCPQHQVLRIEAWCMMEWRLKVNSGVWNRGQSPQI